MPLPCPAIDPRDMLSALKSPAREKEGVSNKIVANAITERQKQRRSREFDDVRLRAIPVWHANSFSTITTRSRQGGQTNLLASVKVSKFGRQERHRAIDHNWTVQPLSPRYVLALSVWILAFFGYMLWTGFYRISANIFRVFFDIIATTDFHVISRNVSPVGGGFIVFASALALGRVCLRFAGLAAIDWTFALGLGLGTFSHLLLGLGLAGLWMPPIIWALVSTPLVLGLMVFGREWLALPKTVKSWPFERPALWEVFVWGLLGCLFLLNLTSALGPEFFYDALVYHLALPKLFLLEGRILPTNNMIFSGVPLGTEMIYGLSLALADERLAKIVNCGIGVAIALTIYRWCRIRANSKCALIGAALFYMSPMVIFENWAAQIELAWTFYTLLSVMALMEATHETDAALSRRRLVLAGMLAGFAVSTKYNALAYLIVLPIPLLQRTADGRHDMAAFVRRTMMFWGIALFVASPWFLKNWYFYGNPAYPFLQWMFPHGLQLELTSFVSETRRNLLLAATTWVGLRDFFLDLWIHDWPMDSYMGLPIKFSLPWIVLSRWRSAEHGGLFSVIAGLWLVWALQTRLPRYLYPALPLVCMLGALAIMRAESPRLLRGLAVAGSCFLLLHSLQGAIASWYKQGLWAVTFGKATKDEYLLASHPSFFESSYAGVRFINAALRPDARVLFIGDERGFYCERRFVAASVYDRNPIVELANESSALAGFQKMLGSAGISHLLLNRGSSKYQRILEQMTPHGRQLFEELLQKQAKALFEHRPIDGSGWVQVYELRT